MRNVEFVTIDVFTRERFGGNPLAVFPDAAMLSDDEMQALAAEFNLSETTFVLPPADPSHTARVRIFNRRNEMPFAGHPNVGTAFALASRASPSQDVMTFEEIAGLVEVRLLRNTSGEPIGASIRAPQPLSLGETVSAAAVADCAGLAEEDVILAHHQPLFASTGYAFAIAEVKEDALERAKPDLAGFERASADHPAAAGRFALHLYARNGRNLRARMFAPLEGTWEDPATGSANAALAGLLLSLGAAEEEKFDIVQGVEMGRPSHLRASAWRTPEGISAGVEGECVPVLCGRALMDRI